jgi:MarR family transcriptional regulator, lower aerobic nicotinate degradation pathway regulator
MAQIAEDPQPEVPLKQAPLPRSLSVWTGYLLSRAGQKCRDCFDALAAPLGIKGRHFSVLALLDEMPGLAQIEMSERLGIDRNTMVLLLNDLESRGLVERRRDPRDRRAHVVTLTAAGQDVLAEGTALAQRTNEVVFAPLSPDEQVQLRALLSRLL